MAERTEHHNFGLAVERYRAKEFAEAREVCHRILAEQPDHVDAIYLLGMMARQTGNHEAAAERLGRAVAIAPVPAGVHYNLANALRDLGKIDDAIASYRRAVTVDPDLAAAAHGNLGNCQPDRRGIHFWLPEQLWQD